MGAKGSWVDQMADSAQARLEELGGLDHGDDSLRSPRAVRALRGLARTVGGLQPVGDFDPEGLAENLSMLADEFERVYCRQMLVAAQRLAA